MPEDRPDLVRRMIRDFYMLDYHHIINPSHKYSVGTMVLDAEMYALADKYCIKGLKKRAIMKMENSLRWSESHLPRHSTAFSIAILIPIIYSTTPKEDRGLRDRIVHFALKFWRDLSTLETLHDILLATPEFFSWNDQHGFPDPRFSLHWTRLISRIARTTLKDAIPYT